MRVIAAIATGLLGAMAVPALSQEREAADNAATSGTAAGAEASEEPVKPNPRPSRRDQIEGLVKSLLSPSQSPASSPLAGTLDAAPGSVTGAPVPLDSPAPSGGAASMETAATPGTPAQSPVIPHEAAAAPGTSPAAQSAQAATPAGAGDSDQEAVESVAVDSFTGSIAGSKGPQPAATSDTASFRYWWAILLVLASVGLGALAAQRVDRRARLVRTRGALALGHSLDADDGEACLSPLSFAGPSAKIRARLEMGAAHG
ncbi:MAG TPA: hypothetical protein VNH53_11260 [Sphingomicrobium sp.]|jgi:hypothetical protein|nr:hypothetical protein [Sphingomicrobium sp.]